LYIAPRPGKGAVTPIFFADAIFCKDIKETVQKSDFILERSHRYSGDSLSCMDSYRNVSRITAFGFSIRSYLSRNSFCPYNGLPGNVAWWIQ